MLNTIKEKWNKIPLTIKVSSSYAICSILQKCLSFFTLPLFTRLLTTEQYGQHTIYSSWQGILMIFLTLNLAYGSFQTAMVKYEDRRSEYISSIQGICILLSCVFLLIYLPFREIWNRIFELPTFLVLIMVSEIIFSTSTRFWMGRNRFEFKYKSVVAVTLLASVLSPILAFVLVSYTEEKGYARIIGYAFINILVGVLIFIQNTKKSKKFFDKEFWSYALHFNIPLIAYYLSQVIFNQSDRIMISHMVGTSEVAMYGVAYSLAMILTFILNAINNSYVPWLYEKIKDGRKEENKSVSIIIAVLMSLMILCVIWYAPEIILIMAGKQYVAATYVVAPVAISLLLLFYSQLFINVEFYYEEKRMLVWASIGAAVLNIVLNYWLIPIFGFVAAGYTTLVSYVVFALSNCYAIQRVLKKKGEMNNLYNYKGLLCVLGAFTISSIIGVALYEWIILRVAITIIVLALTIIFRKKFFDALSILRTK